VTKYATVIMEEIAVGRHIGPAIISRLPASREFKPRALKPQRILIATLVAGGHDLVVVASHWTSRRSDEKGTQRAKYGDLIYGRANEIYQNNPAIDLIVCGDFNDTPDDPSVRGHLRALGDATEVVNAKELRFFNLMAGKDPEQYGTHYYRKPVVYDQICVAPGLLDQRGWTCDADSLRVPVDGLLAPGSKLRRPWRYGGPADTQPRGASDHFPVTVKLRVAGGEVPE